MKKFILGFIIGAILLTSVTALGASWGYTPITSAFRADMPVYVEGRNVNDGLYPVINYKPDGAEYPYLYIPLAMFKDLGMNVDFDTNTNIAYVTNPNKNDRSQTVRSLQIRVENLEHDLENSKKRHEQFMNHIRHHGFSDYGEMEFIYSKVTTNGVTVTEVTKDSVTFKLASWDSAPWTVSYPAIDDHRLFFREGQGYAQSADGGINSEAGILFSQNSN